MADYIYLMETRLTSAQQETLKKVREIAKARGITVFLVGGAVRDLTAGSPVRDLDIAVQGNALKLKKELVSAGGTLTGEIESMQALYFSFAGGVRIEVSSTLELAFPKPGKPTVKSATILDDLRRRDFTANAMAISLNEGSYGLLMDPLNGIADIDNRELRLVSNYGFIEDPVRMVRATRLGARLGWHMEEKTQKRYDAGKAEGYISALNATQRAYEIEEIFHEEDPLRALRKLEAEGWTKFLYPVWTSAKVNETELDRVRDTAGHLAAMGIHPDPSAAYFPWLTAKMASKDVVALKKSFVRPGFVTQIDELDAETKVFATQFTSKAAAAPSETWKMLMSAIPEQVLWLASTSKSGAVQAKFKAFFTEWPQARLQVPYQIMQEMRITPELPGYGELLDKLFFAQIDKQIDTPEAIKLFLEPYSPPAPPPPVNMRRRPVKRETKPVKSRAKKVPAEAIATIPAEDSTVVPVVAAASKETAKAAPPAPITKKQLPAKQVAEKQKSAVTKPVTIDKKQPTKTAPTAKKSKPVPNAKVAKKASSKPSKKPAKKAVKAAVVRKSKPVAKLKSAAPQKKALAKGKLERPVSKSSSKTTKTIAKKKPEKKHIGAAAKKAASGSKPSPKKGLGSKAKRSR